LKLSVVAPIEEIYNFTNLDRGVKMDILFIFKALYVSVAAGFLTATYLEGRHKGDVWDWQRLAGLLACLIWPILLLVTTLTNMMKRNSLSS
jgi:hypothetical protein